MSLESENLPTPELGPYRATSQPPEPAPDDAPHAEPYDVLKPGEAYSRPLDAPYFTTSEHAFTAPQVTALVAATEHCPADTSPQPVSTRFYPLCLPPGTPHQGFDEAPDYVTYERVETFADGTCRKEVIAGQETRRAQSTLGVDNQDFVDEDLLAYCVARVHAGQLLYCHTLHAWFVWDGTIWRRDTTDRIIELIRFITRDVASGNERALAIVGTARFLMATERVARCEQALRATDDAFDADPLRLGTPGGTVDLTTGVLEPADRADRISRATAVTPAETAECPLWRRFLDEAMGGDKALIGFLQRYLGYALTGETCEHALVYGLGEGGNGKSVFVNTVRAIMGDYAIVAAPDLLARSNGSRTSKSHSGEIAMLAGARLVAASETEEGRTWADGRLKLLTGGDPVTARSLGADFFTFTPRFKLLIVGNHMPVLRNVDAAIRRRLCLVPFATTPTTPDRRLESKLRAEWPGILRWMIEGCLAWRAQGLGRPERVLAVTADYLGSQDLVAQFLEDYCDTGCDRTEPSAALYGAWCTFTKAAGEAPGTQRRFAAQLERQGLKRERTRHARVYRGLRLLTECERHLAGREEVLQERLAMKERMANGHVSG